jgi:hypothetical protein
VGVVGADGGAGGADAGGEVGGDAGVDEVDSAFEQAATATVMDKSRTCIRFKVPSG